MNKLLTKLQYKGQNPIIVLNAPESFNNELSEMTAHAGIAKGLENIAHIDFVMVFVTTQHQIAEAIAAIGQRLRGDAVCWFCYPKASSKKYKCDFNRDTGWEALGTYGLEGVRQVAIDEDWSALRFRKVQYIKKMTRKFDALSEEGKRRAGE
jgi:hypothetical protein